MPKYTVHAFTTSPSKCSDCGSQKPLAAHTPHAEPASTTGTATQSGTVVGIVELISDLGVAGQRHEPVLDGDEDVRVPRDEQRGRRQQEPDPEFRAHACPRLSVYDVASITVVYTEEAMAQDLLEVVKDGVALLTLNRPDRLNALSPAMLEALLEALPRLAADAEVGVVVLTGSGRGFCAGGDVKAMAEGRESGGDTLEDKAQALRARMEASRWLHEMPKPTIAMVRGAAAGAGLSLALACDLRVAADGARFATAFARVGYSGDFGGSYFLSQLVGTAKARELYFTADILDAGQALALGLVNRVVPDARLEDETLALARRLASGPRIAYRYMKRNFNAAETAGLAPMLDLEAWHHTRCGMTEDHREAARAFVEKREPVFRGR